MKVQVLVEQTEHGYIELEVDNENEIYEKANEAIAEGTINWMDDPDIQITDWEESPIRYED